MSKYIDADALKRECDDKTYPITIAAYGDEYSCRGLSIENICKIIDKMPAADVEPVERWISVDEQLPEYEGSYLVCTAKSGAFISHYYARSKSFTGGRGRITHWMDRPEPPKNGRR